MNDEEWFVECSDDETYEIDNKNDWTLASGTIMTLIERLECSKQCLNLEWRCPGRRGPSPIPSQSNQSDYNLMEYSEALRSEEKDGFDFMEEMSLPRLRVRRVGEATPKGSAKKKTASFTGVVSTMLRHRRQEQQEINSSPKRTENSTSSNIKLSSV
ncbi:hypothetical protein PV326_013224 [Microctonus aethiopoides]|nr:hypothetical protein PV326_013224 [Microctonus aethiopoides]